MNEQLEFFAPTKTPAPKGSLFLAVFPDVGAVQQVTGLAAGMRSRHGLTGRLRPDHLHLTLHWLGDFTEVPESVIQAVGRACEPVAARVPSFAVTLDRVASFRGRPGNHPLVLTAGDAGTAALMKFHEMLITELARHGCLNKRNLKFSPHLTLLYDKQCLAEELIEPVTWSINEIVLVRSEVGATKYHRLGKWTLGG